MQSIKSYSTFANKREDQFADAMNFALAADHDKQDTRKITLDLVTGAEPVVGPKGVSLRGPSGREILLPPLALRQYATTALGAGRVVPLFSRLTAPTVQGILHDLRKTALEARDREASPGAILYRKSTGEARAVVGPQYAPVFDADLIGLVSEQAGRAGLTLAAGTPGSAAEGFREGGPKALWRNEERSTAFYVSPKPLPGSGDFGGLTFGYGFRNSEVGLGAVRLDLVVFRFQCANLMIWGVENHVEISRRHVGDALGAVRGRLSEALEVVAERAGLIVQSAKHAALTEWVDVEIEKRADAREADALTRATAGLRKAGLSQAQAEAAWASRLRDENRDSAPSNSVWTVAQGVSWLAHEASQEDAATLRGVAASLIAA